jgi:hypothetical protein
MQSSEMREKLLNVIFKNMAMDEILLTEMKFQL